MANDFGSDYMTIVDEDGTEFELEVLSSIEYNGQTYLAVTLAVDASEEVQTEVSILKSVMDGDEPILVAVEDEHELETVYEMANHFRKGYRWFRRQLGWLIGLKEER